jgi:hypothetical protein
VNYKLIATLQAAALIVLVALFSALCMMAYDMGKASNRLTLDNCSQGMDIMHNGKLIRCGIIERVDNLKSARYRAVKNCTKLIKEWEDGN